MFHISHARQINHGQVYLILSVDCQVDGHVDDWQLFRVRDLFRQSSNLMLNLRQVINVLKFPFWHLIVSDRSIIMVFRAIRISPSQL